MTEQIFFSKYNEQIEAERDVKIIEEMIKEEEFIQTEMKNE